MVDITFTSTAENIQRIINAMKGLYPIPRVPNPDYLKDGIETLNEFSDSDWVKECIRQWIMDQVLEYERRIAIELAKEKIEKDNNLIS